MDLDGIKAEMTRKPDANVLIEWIAYEGDNEFKRDHDFRQDAMAAITAYFEALEDQ